jgi:cytochrome P450
MVISEALRMYPPLARLERVAQEDYEYKGMKIPKGTCVATSVWVMQRGPVFYPEPEKFIPERYLDSIFKALCIDIFF